jgi:hypothetical protein
MSLLSHSADVRTPNQDHVQRKSLGAEPMSRLHQSNQVSRPQLTYTDNVAYPIYRESCIEKLKQNPYIVLSHVEAHFDCR